MNFGCAIALCEWFFVIGCFGIIMNNLCYILYGSMNRDLWGLQFVIPIICKCVQRLNILALLVKLISKRELDVRTGMITRPRFLTESFAFFKTYLRADSAWFLNDFSDSLQCNEQSFDDYDGMLQKEHGSDSQPKEQFTLSSWRQTASARLMDQSVSNLQNCR